MNESQRAEILTRLLEAMIASPKYQSASVSQMFRDAQSLADDIESDTNRRQKQERRSAYEPEPTASFMGKRWAKLNPDAVSRLQQEIREVAGLCAKLSRIDSDIPQIQSPPKKMSYNITSWQTKSLEELAIPVASLYKHERTDWHPVRQDHDSGLTVFRVGEFQITGTVQDEWLQVGDIRGSGECSGTAMDLIFEPALADSTGRLVAVRIWAGGDSIDRLTVIDGVVTTEPIEL